MRSSLVASACLVAAGLLAYANSFSGTLVFDDVPAIRENPTIRSLWPITTALSPPANSGLGGRPLANLSFALNYAIGGEDVRGYHALNLLLHLGSALLLFGIVRRTRGASHGGAWATALLWVVHPLTTATVTWISQRTEALMAFFYLLTLYGFARATPHRSENGVETRSKRWLGVSVAACALGMMCKEVMITAPVLVLLYDRTFVAGSLTAAWRSRRGYYLALASTWIVLGYLLTTGLSQRSVGFGLGVSPVDYALTEMRAVLIYLARAFWPTPLIFDYGAGLAVDVRSTVACLLVVALLLAWTARELRRGSPLGFCAASFFLLLAPTSTFVPIAQQPIAENRAYLPLAALIALAGLGTRACGRSHNSSPASGFLPWGAAAAGLALGLTTFARNADYRTELTLWADTVQKRPQNPRAHFNHGVALLDRGRAAEAAVRFERAIALDAREPRYHNSLGNAQLDLGRPQDALPHFREAVRRDPRYARAWHNFGTALLRTGDAAGAIAPLEHTRELDPHNAEARHALGNAHFQLDRPAQALPHYRAALVLDPALADVHYSAGNASLELQRFDEAVAHFAAAAKLKPADAEIRNNLGAALFRSGRRAEAIAELEQALRINPDYGNARDNLALVRAAAK